MGDRRFPRLVFWELPGLYGWARFGDAELVGNSTILSLDRCLLLIGVDDDFFFAKNIRENVILTR